MRTLQVFIDYWFESVILPDAARHGYDRNQRTILIIDDCPEDRETYRRYLLGFQIHLYDFGGRVWGKWAGIVQAGKARCHFAGLPAARY